MVAAHKTGAGLPAQVISRYVTHIVGQVEPEASPDRIGLKAIPSGLGFAST
jgi:hypothetical protein